MDILKYVDHTELRAFATWTDIKKLCEEALANHTASVCIPPAYVKSVKEAYPSLKVCTVIGFPLGYNTTAVKVFETQDALNNGADEIDMVINIAWVKSGEFALVAKEIAAIKQVCGSKVLKVIIETCYLDEEEKIRLCQIITAAKADYIKTSTGFGTAGATFADVALFKEHIGEEVKIKAAGGIRTKEDMEKYLALGCSRLGCSSAVKILGNKQKA